MDLLPTIITNSFKIQNQTFEQHFHFLLWLYDYEIYSFLETSTRFRMTKCLKHKSIYFMHMLTLKQGLHFLKSIFTNENIHDQKTNKTAPSWSFILMLLMTTDKFSKFDRICVDQGLNLVFEGCAILHGMSSNSSMVFTYGIDIVSFWMRKSSRPCGNDRNPIVLDQYVEQFSIRHWKCVVHLGPFPFLALVIA